MTTITKTKANINILKYPFLKACEHGQYLKVQNILKNEFPQNILDDGLVNAVENNHPDIVDLLVRNGANPSAHCEEPLQLAAQNGNSLMVIKLIEYKASVKEAFYADMEC
jgi:ankyrin repeat protein